jgi:hypothetical protein
MKGWFVNDELCTAAVVTYFKELSQHLREETEEDHLTLSQNSRFRAKIWSRDIPNTKQEC